MVLIQEEMLKFFWPPTGDGKVCNYCNVYFMFPFPPLYSFNTMHVFNFAELRHWILRFSGQVGILL